MGNEKRRSGFQPLSASGMAAPGKKMTIYTLKAAGSRFYAVPPPGNEKGRSVPAAAFS
jgi:hypothetical protein